MAVIAPFREANELDVLTKARQLAEYIFTICKNEKQFPRRDRWMLTADILHEAAHVLAHVRRRTPCALQRRRTTPSGAANRWRRSAAWTR